MNNEEQELSKLLSDNPMPQHRSGAAVDGPPEPPSTALANTTNFSQWQVLANERFRPGADTRKKLPSAVYRLGQDDFGPFLERISLASDDFIELPEPAHTRVLEGIRKFWKSRERYELHGLLYKRGILLWGPPGGGKTVTVQLLMAEIVTKHNGIVLLAEHPDLTVAVLRFFRRIEPDRPLIVVFEDVDEIVARFGEHSLLAVLDGEHQTSNVCYLATTNYPERLGARIVNRPSRFDERVKIGMPSTAARMVYLKKAVGESTINIEQWCADTEGLSIAHLRELVVAVLCLEQDYESVMGRLRAMEIMPKPEEGFRRNTLGLVNASANQTAQQAKR